MIEPRYWSDFALRKLLDNLGIKPPMRFFRGLTVEQWNQLGDWAWHENYPEEPRSERCKVPPACVDEYLPGRLARGTKAKAKRHR